MGRNSNDKDNTSVLEKVLSESNQRAELLCYVFSVAFVIYGFSSYEFILKFKSDLTLLDNIWPRLFLNGIPFIALGLFLKKSKVSIPIKAWAWSILIPAIFMLACGIYVWPLLFDGNFELYYYVHGTNLGIIVLMFIITAPTPKYIYVLGASLLVFFLIPLTVLFVKQDQLFTARYIINDFLVVLVTSIYISYQNHRLYKKIILQDIAKRNNVRKFVGRQVSEAIFEDKLESLKERNTSIAVLTIDIKGFTKLIKGTNAALATHFMKKYHQHIAQIIESAGGSIHKTAGDGHLITFGDINDNSDLSFIPGIKNEIQLAQERRKRNLVEVTYKAANEIFAVFEKLKNEFSLSYEIQVSAAIDYGEISLVMIGDPRSRIEYDIIGLPINRCSRVENYSREINKEFKYPRSILVVTEDIYLYLENKIGFQVRNTTSVPVRDFSEIEHVYFQEFRSEKKIRFAA